MRKSVFILLLFSLIAIVGCAGSAGVSSPAGQTAKIEQAGSALDPILKQYASGQYRAAAGSSIALIDKISAKTLISPLDSQYVFFGLQLAMISFSQTDAQEAADSAYEKYSQLVPESQIDYLKAVRNIITGAEEENPLGPEVSNKIAVVLPLSGKYSEFGEAILEGIHLAISEYNTGKSAGDTVEVGIFDDMSDQFRASSTGQKIAADKNYFAMLGSHGRETTLSLALAASSYGIPLIAPSSYGMDMADLGEMVYAINRLDNSMLEELVRFARDSLDYQMFAVLAPDNEQGKVHAEMFRRAVEAAGGNLVADLRYNIENNDFSLQMNLLRRYLPDALFLPAQAQDITQVASQLAYYGLVDVRLLGTQEWMGERVRRMGGKYVEGALIVSSWYEDSDQLRWAEFKDIYEKTYLRPVNYYSALGYDAASILLGGLKLPTNRLAVSEKIKALDSFTGAVGIYSGSRTGSIDKKSFILEIYQGNVIPALSNHAANTTSPETEGAGTKPEP